MTRTASTGEQRTRHEIDCAAMTDRDTAFDLVIRELPLPDHQGRNLDALYDGLWDLPSCDVRLEHAGALDQLGDFGRGLLSVFMDVAHERGEDFELTVLR